MDYNEKKILAARMTQNGVIDELKKALEGRVSDEEAFRGWVADLAEIYTDAVNDIEYHTEQIAKAKAEEENNGE